MDLSESFDDPEISDVILHFRASSQQQQRLSAGGKRQREDDDDGPARSFSVHRIILYASPYFKALLQRWNGRPASEAHQGQPQPSGGRVQLVEHVQHDELEAAEMALRCLYKTGELPQPAHGNPTLLIKMLRLADKYQFPARCMESMKIALCTLDSQKLTAEFISAVYSLPPATFPSEPLQRLLGL